MNFNKIITEYLKNARVIENYDSNRNKLFYCPECKRVWQYNYLNKYKPLVYMEKSFPKLQVEQKCRNCK